MLKWMLIAGLGGFIGTCLRYLCGKLFHWLAPAALFPWGTWVVNVVGSLLIGVLYGLVERYHEGSPMISALLITGFCGGLTTFSSFADDLYLQLANRHFGLFAIYFVGSISIGILMVCIGRLLTR